MCESFWIASQPEEFPWIGLQPVTKGDTGLATSQSQELSRVCGLLHLPWSTLERLIHTFSDCSQSSCSNRYHLHFLHSPHGCYLTLSQYSHFPSSLLCSRISKSPNTCLARNSTGWPIGEWDIFHSAPDTAHVNHFFPRECKNWFKSIQAKQVDLVTSLKLASLPLDVWGSTCSKS